MIVVNNVVSQEALIKAIKNLNDEAVKYLNEDREVYPVRIDTANKSACRQWVSGFATVFTDNGPHEFNYSYYIKNDVIYIDDFDVEVVGKHAVSVVKLKVRDPSVCFKL